MQIVHQNWAHGLAVIQAVEEVVGVLMVGGSAGDGTLWGLDVHHGRGEVIVGNRALLLMRTLRELLV